LYTIEINRDSAIMTNRPTDTHQTSLDSAGSCFLKLNKEKKKRGGQGHKSCQRPPNSTATQPRNAQAWVAMVTLYCTGEGITPQAAEKKKDTSLIVLSISATEYPTAYFMCDMKA